MTCCIPEFVSKESKSRQFALELKLNSYVDHVSEQDRVVERRLSTRTNLNRTNERVSPEDVPLVLQPPRRSRAPG